MVRDGPEKFQDEALVPNGVIGRSHIHQDDTCFAAFFKALFNVVCELHNLVYRTASTSEASLFLWKLGVNDWIQPG